MYELYVADKKTLASYSGSINYKCSVEKILLDNTDLLMTIYWNVITFGKGKVYIVRNDEDKIIHKSYVIPKCVKFPFMKKHDIQIGPCCTEREYRGRGIYPYIVSKIISDESKNELTKAYMVVDDTNLPSINGISKVGFRKICKVKKDIFKRYIIVKKLENCSNEDAI